MIELVNAYNSSDNATSSNSTAPLIEADLLADEGTLPWIIGCVSVIVLAFLITTIQWYRKQSDTPAAKKKARIKRDKKAKALEEKRIGDVRMDPVPVADFLHDYKAKLKDDFMDIEYKALNRIKEDFPQTIALLPCNYHKNGNQTALPFDHSRVCLEAPPTMVDSDYINASYIYKLEGGKRQKAYIAAQGPLTVTVTDFWRMIWQDNCSTVIMLTNVFSYSKQECEKYWHNTYNLYGDIHVKQDKCEVTCHYTTRHFRIAKMGCSKERIIAHYQFHTWTEREMPDAAAVLEFRRKIKMWTSTVKGPTVVHCGDGCGRTGAYIALDMVLDTMQEKHTVNILSTITSLRQFRPITVNHLNQFKFIYDAVAMYLTCGTTAVQAGELSTLVQRMATREGDSKLSGFEKEYKTLQEMIQRLEIGDCAGGHRAENRRKSRDIMIQPPERARPYLMTFDSSDSSDFVNAVYVNGYSQTNEFIVTQWPLKNTCNDLWRLIFDMHVTSVVVLHSASSSRNFPEFWPKKEGVKERFGPVCSTLTKVEYTTNLIIKTFSVKKVLYHDIIEHAGNLHNLSEKEKQLYRNVSQHITEMGEALVNPADISSFGGETRPVQIVFLRSWPDAHKVPMQNYSLLELIDTANRWKKSNSAENTPSLVISKNGVSRAGVYCSTSISLEKLRREGEVDVFNAVKTVMHNRPQLVENLTEYMYGYTFMTTLADNYRAGMRKMSTPPVSNQAASRTVVSSNQTKKVGKKVVRKNSAASFGSADLPSHSASMYSMDRQMLDDAIDTTLPSHLLNGVEPEEKFTDGKGFLHYAMPIKAHAAEVRKQLSEQDNLSEVSSFRMDSDILSMDNAEFAMQSYNNNNMANPDPDNKYYTNSYPSNGHSTVV